MAGTLEISEELCWMPAGWVFDNVLEQVADVLQSSRPDLAVAFRNSTTLNGSGHLDLRELDANSLRSIGEAVNVALANAKHLGEKDFSMPEFFPGFISRFDELREMLDKALKERKSG